MLLLRYNTCMRHQETVAEEDAHNSVFPGWQALGRQKQFTFTTDIIDIYNLASSRHYTLLKSTVCDGYYLVLQAIHTVLYTYNLTCLISGITRLGTFIGAMASLLLGLKHLRFGLPKVII